MEKDRGTGSRAEKWRKKISDKGARQRTRKRKIRQGRRRRSRERKKGRKKRSER